MASTYNISVTQLLLIAAALQLGFMTVQAARLVQTADFYTAGVVEFAEAVQSDADADALLANNLAGYVEIIQSVNASATDIIVFPEATLNSLSTLSFVPAPEQQVNPCQDDPQAGYYHKLLVTLSCAARNASKYVVINLSEQQICSEQLEDPRPCAANNINIYNTNVVFDRSGLVISRYRKVHLYGEPRNTTFLPERIYFETDFGVTFGHFICFDILFYTPAHELVVDAHVRDFVFPSMWFSQLPFLTSVQFQHGWAHAQNVNLLAAGSSAPQLGSSGSGIYHGAVGTLTSAIKLKAGERRIYVAQVPKFPDSSRQSAPQRSRRSVEAAPAPRLSSADIWLKRDALENYSSELLPLQLANNYTGELCHEQFCCHFDIAWQQPLATATHYSYRVGVYNGPRNEQKVDANYIRNCGIFACTNASIEQCGVLFDVAPQQQLKFSRIQIEALYPSSREFSLMTNSLRQNLKPLEPTQFEWKQTQKDDYYQVHFALTDSLAIDDLLTFAIYGNYYDNVCTVGDKQSDASSNVDCSHNERPDRDGAASIGLAFGCWLAALLTAMLLKT